MLQRVRELEATLAQQERAAAAQQAEQQERLHALDRQLAIAAAAASPLVRLGCLGWLGHALAMACRLCCRGQKTVRRGTGYLTKL